MAENSQYISGSKLYALMGVLVMCFFLVTLDMSIVSTAIPYITSQFHSLKDVGWYGSAYQLTCASLLPLAGKIYSNFKAKYVFMVYLAVFEFGSLLCAVANSSKMLIIGRAVAGMGSSGLMNGGLTMASAAVPLHKSPKYFGIMMGISQMGVVCGPLLGGAFTSYVTWRWCFFINLPVGGLAAIALFFLEVPQIAKPHSLSTVQIITDKLDLCGFLLFAPAAIQFFLALDYAGRQYAWNSAAIIGLLCGAAATLIIFIFWEWRQKDNAMIPFSIMRLRPAWSSGLVMVFLFGTLQTASYYLPIYFQTIKRASPLLGAVYTLPGIGSNLISAVISGVAIGRLGYYLPFALASAIIMAIANGLISTWTPATPVGEWIGYQILLGAGRGMGMQAPMIAVQNTIPPLMIPVAMAMISFSQTLGGSIYLVIDETILSNSLASTLPKYAPGVDIAAVIAAGASAPAIEEAVNGDPIKLEQVLVAYAKSVNVIFYLAAGSCAMIALVAWGMGTKKIRKEKPSKGTAGEKA